MITINLIPKEKKQELGLIQLYLTIKNIIVLILVFIIVVAIALVITKAALQSYFDTLVTQYTLNNKYANVFNKDVKAFNQLLGTVDQIQSQYIPWSIFMNEIIKIVPQNVTINSINVNSGKILITGRAKTRDDLLKFQSNLDASEIFDNSDTPLDNLLKREDIDFSTKADVIIDKLKQ